MKVTPNLNCDGCAKQTLNFDKGALRPGGKLTIAETGAGT